MTTYDDLWKVYLEIVESLKMIEPAGTAKLNAQQELEAVDLSVLQGIQRMEKAKQRLKAIIDKMGP